MKTIDISYQDGLPIRPSEIDEAEWERALKIVKRDSSWWAYIILNIEVDERGQIRKVEVKQTRTAIITTTDPEDFRSEWGSLPRDLIYP